jgi:hypothetical protein
VASSVIGGIDPLAEAALELTFLHLVDHGPVIGVDEEIDVLQLNMSRIGVTPQDLADAACRAAFALYGWDDAQFAL